MLTTANRGRLRTVLTCLLVLLTSALATQVSARLMAENERPIVGQDEAEKAQEKANEKQDDKKKADEKADTDEPGPAAGNQKQDEDPRPPTGEVSAKDFEEGDRKQDDGKQDDAKPADESDDHQKSGAESTGDDADGKKADDAQAHEEDPLGFESHDPTDLSHGNATASLEDPAEWKFDLAFYTAVVFVVLLAVLLKFAWGPIMSGLDSREQRIAGMISEAQKNQEEAARQLKAYEEKLVSASEEAQDLIAQARKSAEHVAERIRQEADDAAQKQKQRAVDDIRLAKEQALQELADKVADSAFLVAGRILEREIKPEDHTRLIKESLDRLPSKN